MSGISIERTAAVTIILAGISATAVNGQTLPPVALSDWISEDYPVTDDPYSEWVVSNDGWSVEQITNSFPSVFHGPAVVWGDIVEVIIDMPAGDNDFVGFVLGFKPEDSLNPNAEYLLIDWKGGDQSWSFGCGQSTFAAEGLAVSRVFGIPTGCEFWGHMNLDVPSSDLNNGVEELQRGFTLGDSGWNHGASYLFRLEIESGQLRIFVDDVLEFDVDASMILADVDFGLYGFSQGGVVYQVFAMLDCNENGVPDDIDISEGTSDDCDEDLVPDECQNMEEDCNENGTWDPCDVFDGISDDCNSNLVPDECDPDCNQNGEPDECDLKSGYSEDCNENEQPDECDIAAGTSEDSDGNGEPDECLFRFFTDEAIWLANLPAGARLDSFETTASGVAMADEIMSPPDPDTNCGPVLTFDAEQTGMAVGFTLHAVEPYADFVFEDNFDHPYFYDALSVGELNEHENDDFEVGFSGDDLFAFAFQLRENDFGGAGEYFHVFGQGGDLLGTLHPIPDGAPYDQFIGVISHEPIGSVLFDEDASYDDIAVASFQFVTILEACADLDGDGMVLMCSPSLQSPNLDRTTQVPVDQTNRYLAEGATCGPCNLLTGYHRSDTSPQ
jgi:hypothetical protein